MPSNPDARYNLTELADLAGVTPRTVRYYLSQGLLPAVGTAGPGAKYDDGHLARLRLIRRLQREHQPLAEIRRNLESLDDAEIVALDEPTSPAPTDSAVDYIRRVLAPTRVAAESPIAYSLAAEPAFATPQPLLARRDSASTEPAVPASDLAAETVVERSQWERIAIGRDVELHIRRPLPRSTAKRVDRLVSIARDLLEEDPS
jgi:DNA-binding transcriptional MerR regulator